ncbi:Flavin-containing monooxygenase FMO GS-OX-like 3 [Liparis tanakae]|uniref:Flavin-containing monooxygenase n=1 Tax=Liparis tanakae TaxID=230148 RepID=A0A4Z2G2Q9_9TELE|nr:Flavin-containing monooxygenase FMO GS-OX-like 3 [Liparis tanakae]
MVLQRVAVVGAGAAGLCAARHILSRLDRFAPPVVFELGDKVGGTWCYDDRTGGVHSSMYRDLRTNLPKEVMMFPDFPFESQLSSFLPHQEIQRYLEKYCQKYHVLPHIREEQQEEQEKEQEQEEERASWEVTTSDLSGRQRTETFDSIFVCTGHYSDPHIPHIPGMDHFKGTVLHSHSYRYAEPFSGQSVLVLGAKASGLDISIELARVGAQVTLSHGQPPLTCPLPAGVHQSSPVVSVDQDGSLRLQDGSTVAAEVLMFCTGYKYRFPFLDGPQLGVQLEDHHLAPLYRHLMPPAFPSLFFIGMCKLICPFPNFHCQVQFALAVLAGSVSLPPRVQREDEARRALQEKEARGVERRHLLVMQTEQWEYCGELARAAGFSPLPPAVRSLYEEVWRRRRDDSQNYRARNYRLVGEERWEQVQ